MANKLAEAEALVEEYHKLKKDALYYKDKIAEIQKYIDSTYGHFIMSYNTDYNRIELPKSFAKALIKAIEKYKDNAVCKLKDFEKKHGKV